VIFLNKRIFFSLNLPENVKEEIYKKYGKEIESDGLKKVKKDNLHITLLFLGYFPEEKIKELEEKLQKVKMEKFSVFIKGIKCFNSRVMFLELKKGEEKIKELNEKICEVLEIRDTRFNSHLTVLSSKGPEYKKIFSVEL